ncbi:acyl-CoA thioesterase [Streptomyces alboniger]|uniref:Acyl-CoA thioesterase n=1 Tax=Streptomyces alboniger TaxID=132473 RepID=A0A5J6HL97_STRAD|nr:acyl-CoA thioesterase [Streptomyces alboniger]QEV21089.1 acyl-CoA thioesterase [Streptomyces alboniger]
MAEPFSVSIGVRGYETDSQGHLNQAVYLQYAEHARWSLLRAAGIAQTDLLDKGVGPVALENTVRYRSELRAGDETTVSCAFVWGERKTFRMEQTITKADGTVAATVSSLGGLLDLKERRMVEDPREYFRTLAVDPALLGL